MVGCCALPCFNGGFKKLEDLSRLLSLYSRAPIDLAPHFARWDELDLTLSAFNERIEDQSA